ncbi:MAG TPA: hypothetical protein VM869_33175 [Enhygromyxa sp.]|nr:hypothetical protein [Enhygromyxa sp.]
MRLAIARLLGAAVLLASLVTACEAHSDDRAPVSERLDSDDREP